MKTKLVIISVLCLTAITACRSEISSLTTFTSLHEKAKINKAEAISIAGEFIRINGYTDLPPTTDRTKLSFETIEWESDIEEMLKNRHYTLQRKAFGVLSGRKGQDAGWTVVFQYTDGNKKTGRAVTMDLYGDKLRVEHIDIFLKAVEKKL